MKRLYLYPVRLLYPPRCVFCQEIIEVTVDNFLCFCCEKEYPVIEDPTCNKCGKQLAHDDDLCFDCGKSSHLYEKGISLYPYEGTIKEALYRFKYGGKRKYGKFFAKTMYKQLKLTEFYHRIDLIIPVPVSMQRLEERGYNQAEEIARYLSKISGLPYNSDILIRIKDTRPQSEYGTFERSKNIKDAFTCVDKLNYKDKVILIIDDIYTTGSTINECSKVLLDSGADEIYSCVVCIGR